MPTVIHESRHQVTVDGDHLVVVVTLPADQNTSYFVVLLHGGPGGQKDGPGNLYVDLADRLARAGIGSVRFDFRGCGESSGQYRDMTIARQVQDLEAVRAFADATFAPVRWGIVGESFGATVGLRGLTPDYWAIVLLWPAIWLLDGAFESYVTEDNMKAAEQRGYVELDGEEIGLDFLRELTTIGDVSMSLQGLSTPVLFVHGEQDSEVPFRQSVRGSQLVTGPVRLVPVAGGDHCLAQPDEREVVYHETVAWLRDHLPA